MADPRQVAALSTDMAILSRRDDSPFTDDLKSVVTGNLIDGINAAWNGWETACKMEDEGMQTYYMKYVITLHATLEKVRKI